MRRLPWTLRAFLATGLLGLCLPATADASAPRWRISSVADSTVVPGAPIVYHLQIVQDGTAPTDGSPIALRATLPAGIVATATRQSPFGFPRLECGAGSGQTIVCEGAEAVEHSFRTTFTIEAQAAPSASGSLTAVFALEGGGGAPARTAQTVAVTSLAPAFGVAAFDSFLAADAQEHALTQAGGHPYGITTAIALESETSSNPTLGDGTPVESLRDAIVDLPVGLVGDATAIGRCTSAELANSQAGHNPRPLCPPSSQVGVASASVDANARGTDPIEDTVPLFNMAPPPGVPASFGFNFYGTVVRLNARARTASDYGLSIDAKGISQGVGIDATTVTFWGVPADPSHDDQRDCPGQFTPGDEVSGSTCAAGVAPVAILRNPTSCSPAGSAALRTTLSVDSWEHPGRLGADGEPEAGDGAWKTATSLPHEPPGFPYPPGAQGAPVGTDGCALEPFEPSLRATPSTQAPDSPSGLSVRISMPQEALTDPHAIAQADLRKVVLTLPEGMRLNPSSADGLAACSSAQIALRSSAAPSCPEASRIGSVQIDTPLLAQPLLGSVYLAAQGDNPFGSLLALYVVAEGSGTTVKLAGHVEADAVTGRLTTTFDDQPQLPFETFSLALESGPRAPLTTPAACGPHPIEATLEGWNGKTATLTDPYEVQCIPTLGSFGPAFAAGVANPLAGAYSPFVLRLRRADGEAGLGTLSAVTLPPGLLADVAGVPTRCDEAQAATGACPAASRLGTVTVGSGSGPSPFYVSGDVYLMGAFSQGPFSGDPFGLAFVVRALAGPFDLGQVVVRAGIRVRDDGSIATSSEPFPQILQGIPLDLRDIRVSLDRARFMFNPTSCAQQAIGASVSSTAGQLAAPAARFQLADCRALAFRPRFSVATAGNGTFKHNGASLDVKIAAPGQGPANPIGRREANIRKVEVQLPLALPSRLETLQLACTQSQFAADPGGCPAEARVGQARATSPVLAAPLEGPAYLVSHGGAGFPDLVLVLRGEGIVLHVTGHTQVRKGVTYSRFETVPDAPISSFELTLPEGPFSLLAATVDLCHPTRVVTVVRRRTLHSHGRTLRRSRRVAVRVPAPLLMPTTITAQDGAVLRQSTRIAVTGCRRAQGARRSAPRR